MSKMKKILIGASAVGYVLSIIFTIVGNQFAIELLAPITLFLVFLVLMNELKYLGPHKYSTFFMGVGFLCIIIGVTYRFFNHFVLQVEPYSDLIRTIYVMPSVFFAINECSFLIFKLKKRRRDISHLFANSFATSIIGFVFIYKFYVASVGYIESFRELYYLMFIFAAFFVIMMCIQTFYLVGVDNIKRGTILTTIAMFIYEVMDIHYIYIEATGGNPESNFNNLIYMTLIILMTAGISIQVYKKYSFDFVAWDYSIRSTNIRIFIAVVCGVITAILYAGKMLTNTEASYIVIVLMAYMLMSNILRTDSLNDELFDREKKYDLILEEKVREQTKDLKVTNEKLELLSSTDMLTGLYNRLYLSSFLEDIIKKARAMDKSFALFIVDLNFFDSINDTYGNDMGDRVLEELGNRMRELSEAFTCFRMSGDEFMIIYKINESLVDLEKVAKDIQTIFNTPVKLTPYVFNLSASIGIAMYPQDSVVGEELLEFADTAMNSVKQSENKDDYRFFSSYMLRSISMKAAIEERLKTATPDGDFVLYYQPQVDSETKEIVGVEAFPHFKGEMEELSPADIIPVAEESGFMSRLGIWIANTALKQISDWNVEFGKTLSLTINLSPLQLVDEDYASALRNSIRMLGFSPSMVTLDVENSAITGAASSAKQAIKDFHDEGYMLSLNDFSGEDINLSYVHDCEFNGIKLSKDLVEAPVEDSRASVLIDAILAFAKKMGIVPTAVGVETMEQSENMRRLGISQLQGYYYGRPVKAEGFADYLR